MYNKQDLDFFQLKQVSLLEDLHLLEVKFSGLSEHFEEAQVLSIHPSLGQHQNELMKTVFLLKYLNFLYNQRYKSEQHGRSI